MDYKNGKVYRVICEETNRQYIGSTCTELRKRLHQHKRKGNTCMTKDFINPSIFLIEDYPCERKEQLLMRERHFMETMECVNMVRPIVSREEKLEENKEYREKNKEKLNKYIKEYREKNKEYMKEYREKNKEKIKEYNKEYNKEYRQKNKEYMKEYYQHNKDEINRQRRERRAAAKLNK